MNDQTLPPLPPTQAPASMEDLMALTARKNELAEAQAQVDAQLAAAREGAKGQLISHIQELIVSTGFTFAEVAPHLDPSPKPKAKRAKKKAGESKAPGNYPTYVDPANPENTYKRGVLPAWFKDKMAALGLDAGKKEDRETFKANHLTAVSAATPAAVEETHNA